MSSIHRVSHWDRDFVIRNRHRPKHTSTNAQAARLPFGDQQRRLLPIPSVIDSYNGNMNGVDSFDQRRACFDAQLRSRRNWLSIYQFILDIALVNSIAVVRMRELVPPSMTTAHIRLSIASSLLRKGRELMSAVVAAEQENSLAVRSSLQPRRGPYVTARTSQPPAVRLTPGTHLPVSSSKKRRCFLCRFTQRAQSSSQQSSLTAFKCSKCVVYLCCKNQRPCFLNFHSSSFVPNTTSPLDH